MGKKEKRIDSSLRKMQMVFKILKDVQPSDKLNVT